MTTKTAILQAIRGKCLDCSAFQPSEVRQCRLTMCAVWPFRMGEDPAPSQNRGFAKPPVNTGDSAGSLVSGYQGSAPPASCRKSSVPAGSFEDGDPVGAGSIGVAPSRGQG
jgi:hypothetical protein